MSQASIDTSTIYQLYVSEKGTNPTNPIHLLSFAKHKGLKLKFVDAKRMISTPPKQSSYTKPNNNSTISKPKSKKQKIFINKTVAQLMANGPYKPNNKSVKPNKPIIKPIQTKSKPNANVNNFGKYIELVKIYNGYFKEKGEYPSNSFDLMNYIQYHNINGVTYDDISQFLMKYNPSDINKITNDIINTVVEKKENNINNNVNVKYNYNKNNSDSEETSVESHSMSDNYNYNSNKNKKVMNGPPLPPPVLPEMLINYGINTVKNN